MNTSQRWPHLDCAKRAVLVSRAIEIEYKDAEDQPKQLEITTDEVSGFESAGKKDVLDRVIEKETTSVRLL
jgi:hypothetical protein